MDFYVINLAKNVNRWISIQNLFKPFTNITLHRFEAIYHENGAIGCFLSHQALIRFAKEHYMSFIVVLEDDCLPLDNNFESRILYIKEYLLSNTWNLFIGGGSNVWDIQSRVDFDRDNLFLVHKIKCAHLTIYHSSTYDFYLELDANKHFPIDKCWYGKYLAIVPLPFLARQSPGYSDIEKKQVDYTKIITVNNYLIRKYQKLLK